MHGQTLEEARERDAADPLAKFRAQFALPVDAGGVPLIYLCGHSLGLMPLAARELVTQELDDWARLGVLGHDGARRPWIDYPDLLRADLASLVGARADEVVAMNTLTINLHLMLASFLAPQGRRNRVLIEAGAFSSDRHAVASQLEWHGLDPETHLVELAPERGEDLIRESALEALLAEQGETIALVLWPGVQFRTGQAFDLPRIAAAARAAGAVVGFDLAHSIGNTPVDLRAAGADFAVWCSYKYLNGGPGAIGGCFVHTRHFEPIQFAQRQGDLGYPADLPGRRRLSGWWGHERETRFDMGPLFIASPGAAGFQVSNQSILSAAPLITALALFREAGFERLRAKSVALTRSLEVLIDRAAPAVGIVTAREPFARGAQLSLRIAGAGRGRRVFDWLAARGAICDWRAPDILRVAPVPLYNSFEEVWRFAELLREALEANP